MQRIPGNAALDQRWEFCAIVGHYYGGNAQFVVSWFYNISLQSTNVASMIGIKKEEKRPPAPHESCNSGSLPSPTVSDRGSYFSQSRPRSWTSS